MAPDLIVPEQEEDRRHDNDIPEIVHIRYSVVCRVRVIRPYPLVETGRHCGIGHHIDAGNNDACDE